MPRLSQVLRLLLPQIAALCLASISSAICVAGEAPSVSAQLAADFAQPPLCWKSRPLWFWNAKPEKTLTTEIMQRGLASGYAGFGILPYEKTSLPFMGNEYLDAYRHAIETASKLGQKMCLYDEYWFPSGAAGGLLRAKYPEALSKRLDRVETDVAGPADVSFDIPAGRLMAAVAMNNATWERFDITDRVSNRTLKWQAPAGSWSVMAFVCVDDGSRDLVDYLDAESVKKFASITYEGYFAAFPEHFGKTVDSAFYDEPTFHWTGNGRSWTPAFNEKFEQRYHRNPHTLYPALWREIGPDTAAARNALFGMRSQLFAEGFVKTLADWCTAHGIELTGHQDQEESVNPVCLSGDMIKCFEYQTMPGIDEIFNYARGAKMFRIVSSAAVNYGRRRVMSETYGAMKDLPTSGLYKEAMDQFAAGVNLLVPHAVWTDPDHIIFPPELSWRTSPYGDELPKYNDYVGRCQRILQMGRPVADIAVLYPIHDLQAATWFDGPLSAYDGMCIPPWADYEDIGDRLARELRRSFTFLHPETIDSRCKVSDGVLRLNHPEIFQDYRVLILPGSQVISVANLEVARKFFASGGKIIATTCLPTRSAEPGQDERVRALVREIFGEEAAGAAGRVARYPVIRASSVPSAFNPQETPGRAVDGQPTTGWSPDAGASGESWLCVEFGQPRVVRRVQIQEDPQNVEHHRVEYWDGFMWKACVSGDAIGGKKDYELASVRTAKVRLVVTAAAGKTPRIAEFALLDEAGRNLAQLPAISPDNKLRTVNESPAGGRALFVEQPSVESLARALESAGVQPDVAWSGIGPVSGGSCTYLHKEIDGRQFYYFANSSDSKISTTVTLRGEMRLERWDPHTGQISPQNAEAANGVTRLQLDLAPVASVFLVSR